MARKKRDQIATVIFVVGSGLLLIWFVHDRMSNAKVMPGEQRAQVESEVRENVWQKYPLADLDFLHWEPSETVEGRYYLNQVVLIGDDSGDLYCMVNDGKLTVCKVNGVSVLPLD